jgi:hypothetical protein
VKAKPHLILVAACVLLVGACGPDYTAKPTGGVPSATSSPSPVVTQAMAVAPSSPAASPSPSPVTSVAPPAAQPAEPPPAGCGEDYYVNSDGNCVHRPENAPAPPAGATAECEDGTYSFSQHRSGTCSHHGGVKRWL